MPNHPKKDCFCKRGANHEKVIGNHRMVTAPYLQLRPDFIWQVSVELVGAGIKQFTIDCRTGTMSEVTTSWRID